MGADIGKFIEEIAAVGELDSYETRLAGRFS
jgi:hypothetical protein